MGAPSQEQIDEAIADGLARRDPPEVIEADVLGLSRMTDAELAAMGIVPHVPAKPAARTKKPAGSTAKASAEPASFEPAAIRTRQDGWTADRQRNFIAALAETGCVSEACAEVGITARSAYRLREHPLAAAFRAAWDHAQS
nr:hypothetical protein [Acidobacteriota bacterium]